MNIEQVIAKKRDGVSLSANELSSLAIGYAEGKIPDYQMSAFCMAVFFRGMDVDETIALTLAMRDSGVVMQWPDLDRPVVDKHSTGGIGDKISIPLAPMLAACGLAVPMISGRALGATGGTLDKMESISGFRTDLDLNQLQTVVRDVGCVITGASAQIAPADRRLYALRDVTATVPSIPLITASILSKKLSEGLDALVLDVKWGSGSFMKSLEQAEQLANSLVQVAGQMGVAATALITDMNQPLGRIGNAVEVAESIEILKNNVSQKTITLTVALGSELLASAGVCADKDQAITMLLDSIRSGKAYEIFERMVSAQGGELSVARPRGKEHILAADRAGYVQAVDAEAFGWAVIEMKGGRKQLGDELDHSTGLEWLAEIGQQVEYGDPLLSAYCPDDQYHQLEDHLRSAITLGDHPVSSPELIVKRISGDDFTDHQSGDS